MVVGAVVVVVVGAVVVVVVVVPLPKMTSTSKDFSAVASCPVLALHLTVVTPMGNLLPDAGVHLNSRMASGELSAEA